MKKLLLTILCLFVSSYGLQSQNIDSYTKKSDLNTVVPKLIKSSTVKNKTKDQTLNQIENSSVNDIGVTPGQFGVSLSGAATYNIPFATPAGIKNIGPGVGLAYNGGAGNGIAGWSWNISGLSTISRIPSTKYHDGIIDPVDFDNLDRYALDGQRLLLKNGTYGSGGSEYETETYSNVKIIAYGTSSYGAAYGPLYFVAYYPDGTRAYYGMSGGSRSKLQWSIYKKVDPQGNFIEYNYTNTGGLLQIKDIYFGARSGTSPNKISFIYRDRVRPETTYIGNQNFINSKILSRVEVYGLNQLYRKYTLSHNTTSLGYERLFAVTESNGENKTLAPVNFYYDNSPEDIINSYSSSMSPEYDYQKDLTVSGDFNGDGKTDFISYDSEAKNQINVFDNIFDGSTSAETGISYPLSKFEEIFPSDILNTEGKLLNKQGITIVSESVSSGYTSTVRFKNYYHNTSGLDLEYTKTWNAPAYQYNSSCSSSTTKKIPKEYISGDFNGDGLTDVLALGKPYTNRYCYEYDCNTGGTNDDNSTIGIEPPGGVDVLDPNPGGGGTSGTCCSCSDNTNENKNAYFIDLKRDLTSNFAGFAGALQEKIDEEDRLLTGDFNGDGRSNLFHFKSGNVYIYELKSDNTLSLILETSDTFIHLDHPILLGDFNGDGKVDFTVPTQVGGNTWKFFMSKGTTLDIYSKDVGVPYEETLTDYWTYEYGSWTDVEYHYSLVEFKYISYDYNGDGKTDILVHSLITPIDDTQNYSYETINGFSNTMVSGTTSPTFTHLEQESKLNIGSSKYGVPVFQDVNRAHGNLEYAYVSKNQITSYEFTKSHRKDTTLKEIHNIDVNYQITYDNLLDGSSVYAGNNSQVYPYVNINIAPSSLLVKEVIENGAGKTRKQQYKYIGAVVHADGLGHLGFMQHHRTNWFGDDVSVLWTTTDYDPQKRGAMVQSWTADFLSFTPYNYINKTNYTYATSITGNNVFINVPTEVTAEDALLGISSTTSYVYNSYYNPLTITNIYPGGSKISTYEYSNDETSNNQYYHIGRPTRKTIVKTLAGNTFSNEEQFTYNNNLMTQIKKKGNGTSWLTENFQYDAWGNITQKSISGTGVTTRTEQFEYDASGRFLVKEISSEGLETVHVTETKTGNPLTITNPYGLTTTYEYDGWNKLIKQTDYLGKHTNFTFERVYLPEHGYALLKTTDYEQGQDEKVYYNAFGWIVKEGVLSLNNKWVYVDHKYDTAGKKLQESDPYFSNESPSLWNTYDYDTYGRLISHINTTGRQITSTYNGLTTTVDDEVKVTTSTKDAVGNIVSMQDPGGTINYTYYANNMLKSADYDGHVVTTTIDGWGRKIALYDPSAGNYTYEYNIFGELLKETTPKGETTYQYDAFGKITEKQINGDLTELSLEYSYDPTSKLVTSIDGEDVLNNKNYLYNYSYDSYKRIEKVTESNTTAKYEKRVSYDTYGRVDTETLSTRSLLDGTDSWVKTKNSYDTAGILNEIRDFTTNTTIWKTNEENARGQLLKASLGNGIEKVMNYNQYGLLNSAFDYKNENNVSVEVFKLSYDFNSQRGVLNSRTNHNFNWTENFTYDQLDRLTNISGDVELSKQYDERGRITSNSHIGEYNYDSSNAYRVQNIDLNNRGDLYYQQHSYQNISYNAFKSPVEISEKEKGKVSFEYNPLMGRSHAYYGGLSDDKTQRRYHKQYSGIIPAEITRDTETGSTKIITYFGGDEYTAPVAHIKRTEGTNVVALDEYHYLHRDYLGSILAISNSSGELVEERQFGAWGLTDKFQDIEGNTTFSHSSLIDRGFTGHEHFFEVSLIHMNGRMYDAKLGRFLSPDNFIQEPYSTQSFNRFGYVWNNPLNFSDPSGEFIFTALIIGAAVGAYFGGKQANEGKWNPLDWDWSSGDTWMGIGGGAVVGGVAGVVGAVVGPAAVAAIPGVSGGILGGAIAGVAGGAAGGFIQGGLMAGLPGGNGDFFGGALSGAAGGALFGGVLGAGFGAIFTPKGYNIWTGNQIRNITQVDDVLSSRGVNLIEDAIAIDADATIPKPSNPTNASNVSNASDDLASFKKYVDLDGNTRYVNTSTKALQRPIGHEKQGLLTDGVYRVSKEGMARHLPGGNPDKSHFYSTIDAEELALRAAQYADDNNLWIANKAKVPVANTNIGTTSNGAPTNYVNVYRTNKGLIHASPGNPPK